MEYTGQRFINASRGRVWAALTDTQTLAACFAAPDMVRKVADGSFRLGPPINQTVTLSASQAPETLTYTAPQGSLRVTLAEEGPQMTRFSYVLDAPPVSGIERQLDSVLSAFQTEVAGPPEIGAGGLANAQEAATGD